MLENFRVKGKKLYYGFVDLEKTFDDVPREVIRWTMRKLGVEEWLIVAVMSTYTGAKTYHSFFSVGKPVYHGIGTMVFWNRKLVFSTNTIVFPLWKNYGISGKKLW